MNHFIYTCSSIISFHGRIKPTNCSAPNVDGFIAQLVEHRTGNAKVMDSNPVEA